MKKHRYSTIISIILTTVLILSSCALKDNRDKNSAVDHDTPKPEQIINGKNGLGMFKLTVTDEITGAATLEFTDAIPKEEADTLPDNVEMKRIYSLPMTLTKIERGIETSNTAGRTLDKYFLSVSDGYEMFVRTVFSGRGAKEYVENEKQKLFSAFKNGEISKQAYDRSISILDGDGILYENGASFVATVNVHSNKSAYLYQAKSDAEGDGRYEYSVSTYETGNHIITNEYNGTSVFSVKTSLSGFLKTESLGVTTDNGVIYEYEKYYDTYGNVSKHVEYHENGKVKRSSAFYTSGNPSSISDYNENGIQTLSLTYYESGNISSETQFDANGKKITVLSYADVENAIPTRTDYADGVMIPVLEGEQVELDKFIKELGGFWMENGSADQAVIISDFDGMEYICIPDSYGIYKTHFIDQVTYSNGYYNVGIKNGSSGSLYDVIILKTDGKSLTVNDSQTRYVFDKSREYLGDLPDDLTVLQLTELEKFLGTWTDFLNRGKLCGIKRTDKGYVWYGGFWETDAYYEATVKAFYTNGKGKYTVAFLSETHYSEMSDSIVQGSLSVQSFYEVRSGTYRQITLLDNSQTGYKAYILHPNLQLPWTDDNILPADIPETVTPSEIVKIFEGVWETNTDIAYGEGNDKPRSSISFALVNGEPRVVVCDAEGIGMSYYLTAVTYYDKIGQYILTLTNPALPPVAQRTTELRFTPHANYKNISVYHSGSYSSFDIYSYNESKTYPYQMHSSDNEGVRIDLENLDPMLGTWSEEDHRLDMLHIYKEDGKYRLVQGNHSSKQYEDYEIIELRSHNNKLIIRCRSTKTENGSLVTREKFVFISLKPRYPITPAIGNLFNSIICYGEDGVGLRYVFDPALSYPLESDFPYSSVVLDRITPEQLCSAIGGYFKHMYRNESVKIELLDGQAVFTFENVKGLSGEFTVIECYESCYYKTYKVLLSGADGGTPQVIYVRPSQVKYDRFAILDSIDSGLGAITYYKK